MFFHVYIFVCLQFIDLSFADHYKGGSISWKPINPNSISGPTVDITITERHSWTLARYPCNDTTINTYGVYNDTQAGGVPASLTCISSAALCTSSLYQTINSPLSCTDFSTVFQISSGTYYTTQTLALNSIIDIAWRGSSWVSETLANQFSVVSHIDLTPINGKINTSPVTGSIPIFQTYVGQATVIQILASDVDDDQVVRCRWSYQVPIDECGDACSDLPNPQLDSTDCLITWTPVLRAADVANGLTASTYIVAITAEDFANASSTTALSSVPHQVLVYVTSRPAQACASAPSVSAFPSRNLACYAVLVGSVNNYNFQGNINTGCPSDTIVEFISTSPFFTTKSALYQVSTFTWEVNVTWTANTNQTGLQPFCVVAVDNNGQTSSQFCVMIMVGSTSPGLYTPSFIPSTASPVGTVMSTQTSFSIEASLTLRRTTLNSTFITIYRLDTNAQVYQIDCRISPDVYFLNTTVLFFVQNPPWVLGVTYYITMTQGVATSTLYCGTEGGGFSDNSTWRFTIGNPATSSTTTTSTTTSTTTTSTVTTLVIGTTTTTGLPATLTTTTTTSTTSTTSTSQTTATTTSATTVSVTTTPTTAMESAADASVIYPKDFENKCLQPIAIMTAVITIAMIPLHFFAMITLFVKTNSHYQKETLRDLKARRMRSRSSIYPEEHETFV